MDEVNETGPVASETGMQTESKRFRRAFIETHGMTHYVAVVNGVTDEVARGLIEDERVNVAAVWVGLLRSS